MWRAATRRRPAGSRLHRGRLQPHGAQQHRAVLRLRAGHHPGHRDAQRQQPHADPAGDDRVRRRDALRAHPRALHPDHQGHGRHARQVPERRLRPLPSRLLPGPAGAPRGPVGRATAHDGQRLLPQVPRHLLPQVAASGTSSEYYTGKKKSSSGREREKYRKVMTLIDRLKGRPNDEQAR
ncbi:hypothetical protein ON010_g10070 [Phytophthora cinnamomi]|nr:hypothetical protein ON010_g10070 [Phytophthora cinnamomi]